MAEKKFPRLIFPNGFDERDVIEAPDRGYYGLALVKLSNEKKCVAFFYEPVRLQQDLDELLRTNMDRCVADPGLVVIPSVTKEAMCAAIDDLVDRGYFDFFMPLNDTQFQKIFPLQGGFNSVKA